MAHMSFHSSNVSNTRIIWAPVDLSSVHMKKSRVAANRDLGYDTISNPPMEGSSTWRFGPLLASQNGLCFTTMRIMEQLKVSFCFFTMTKSPLTLTPLFLALIGQDLLLQHLAPSHPLSFLA